MIRLQYPVCITAEVSSGEGLEKGYGGGFMDFDSSSHLSGITLEKAWKCFSKKQRRGSMDIDINGRAKVGVNLAVR